MRHQNSAIHPHRVPALQIIALAATTLAIALCGCNQMQQQTRFNPVQQPKLLTDNEKQSVDEILKRQDELHVMMEKKAAEEAAAEAAAAAKALKEGAVDAAAKVMDDVSYDTNVQIEYPIAQVSFETEVEDEQAPAETESTPFGGYAEFAPDVQEAFVENVAEPMEELELPNMQFGPSASDANVTLTASVDDLEGVPFNIARDEFDLSQANFLRPSVKSEPPQTSPSDTNKAIVTEAQTFEPFDAASATRLPLQPMLFNPETRTTKTIMEGTLRPLNNPEPEPEPQVDVERAYQEFMASEDAFSSPKVFGPLAPLRNPPAISKPQTVKLTSREESVSNPTPYGSRLLQPIERTSEIKEVVAAEKPVVEAPVMVSEEIIVMDPAPTPLPAPAPVPKRIVVAEPVEKVPAKAPAYSGPVVDATLASASYLVPTTPAVNDLEETFIPVEVIEDAKVVAEDVARELEATPIPVESFPVVNNDFKIKATSNIVQPSQFEKEDRGEPMFENNDFAEPESPGGNFLPPMVIVPAEVPVASPKPIVAAPTDFGGEVNLEAPPETDSVVAHVAALPVTSGNAMPATSSKVPPVGVSTLMELSTVTWKSRLDEAIELAEERLNRINNPSDSEKVNLRLLKALRGQMVQMENTSATGELTENESQYWQHQLEAITSMLGSPAGANQAVTDYHRHQTAHKTLEHLRNAVSQLESIASLKVNSGQFCTEITGFGQFRTFASNAFSAGQRMLVYCEVENYKTVQHESGTGENFRTRLKGSFAIYDANGNVVQQAEYPTVDDVARKRRRDFYMYLPVTLGELPSGQYVLHALVEDVYGNKTASLDPPLQFTVK